MPELVSADKIKTLVGKENGVSEWILIDQDRINRFADATDDHQWIHVDIEKAKKRAFRRTHRPWFFDSFAYSCFQQIGEVSARRFEDVGQLRFKQSPFYQSRAGRFARALENGYFICGR